MAKILLVNPNKWGRGITSIWIASHSGLLKKNKHKVELFDATFYENWNVDETAYNTKNMQYKETDYKKYISYSKEDVYKSLQDKVNSFDPDIIFWSAISSHIHGEDIINDFKSLEISQTLVNKLIELERNDFGLKRILRF